MSTTSLKDSISITKDLKSILILVSILSVILTNSLQTIKVLLVNLLLLILLYKLFNVQANPILIF